MRKAGVLLPLSSLPSPYGVGTLGREAYLFVDFLAKAGHSLWQMLPIGPTGFGDSPYQSFSSWAGNPYFIDFDLLLRWGLLLPEEIGNDWGEDPAKVDYALLFNKRFKVLEKAAARQSKTAAEYRLFCKRNAFWLEDYSLFMAIKEAYGHQSFLNWPLPLRKREEKAMKMANAQWGARAEFWRCLQYFFYKQWAMLKRYAKTRGIEFMGDIPIYVSPDSSELWANPNLFQTNLEGVPTAVAGVPPDAFSKTGQLWGNPLYNWQVHRRTGYAWWLARLHHAQAMYGLVRIDHFRAFADYYAIPAGDKTAQNGKWVKGPGKNFINAVKKAFPNMEIIAEDLGELSPLVHELLEYSGYPGMRVLQFAFDGSEENDFLPHRHIKHAVVYTGTHDNATTQEWLCTSPKKEVALAKAYLNVNGEDDFTHKMVRAGMASVCETAIIPMQDWLRLGEKARMNKPSTLGEHNWCWRILPGEADDKLAQIMYKQAKLYGRLNNKGQGKLDRETCLPLNNIHLKRNALQNEASKQKREENLKQKPKNKYDNLKVLTANEMREAEKAANAGGLSFETLMENAGKSAAKNILELWQGEKKALFLCGCGNNAGDAFVIARVLAKQNWNCEVRLLCGKEFSPLAQLNFKKLPKQVKITGQTDNYFSAPIIIDGVFGTGFKGNLPRQVATQFAKANLQKLTRIALDLPSGMNCDTGKAAQNTFRAELTFTFAALKPALVNPLNKKYYGEVCCLDVGLLI